MNNQHLKTLEGSLLKHAKDNVTVDVSKAANEANEAIRAICRKYGLVGDESFIRERVVEKLTGNFDYETNPTYKIDFTPEHERRMQNKAVDDFIEKWNEAQEKVYKEQEAYAVFIKRNENGGIN